MGQNAEPCTAGSYFRNPEGQSIFATVAAAVSTFGPLEVRVSKSQIAFRRRRGFAYLWHPGQYVQSSVPAVLSLALPREVPSPRFKEVSHPSPSIWIHHLELHAPALIDAELKGWLREAYDGAA